MPAAEAIYLHHDFRTVYEQEKRYFHGEGEPLKPEEAGELAQLAESYLSEPYPVYTDVYKRKEYYVYVIREKETLLGDEWEAVRKKVTVLYKNENYSAIEGVGEKDKVIIESSRYLQDQDRIEEMKE